MPSDLLAGFVAFALVTLFTPGPNNFMLMTSGLNHGWRRTMPHLLGVALGFSMMVVLVGLGIGAVFETYPWAYAALKWAGAIYLLHLAWTIARAGPLDDGQGAGSRPMTFLGAALFQWVNPKAWVMAVGAVTTYAAIARFPFNVLAMAAIFCGGGIFSSGTWVLFGQALRRLLSSPAAIRAFNLSMAALLVASLLPVIWDAFR